MTLGTHKRSVIPGHKSKGNYNKGRLQQDEITRRGIATREDYNKTGLQQGDYNRGDYNKGRLQQGRLQAVTMIIVPQRHSAKCRTGIFLVFYCFTVSNRKPQNPAHSAYFLKQSLTHSNKATPSKNSNPHTCHDF